MGWFCPETTRPFLYSRRLAQAPGIWSFGENIMQYIPSALQYLEILLNWSRFRMLSYGSAFLIVLPHSCNLDLHGFQIFPFERGLCEVQLQDTQILLRNKEEQSVPSVSLMYRINNH